jgi:hypothetical protein
MNPGLPASAVLEAASSAWCWALEAASGATNIIVTVANPTAELRLIMADCIERAFQIASKNDTASSRRNIREYGSRGFRAPAQLIAWHIIA